MKTRPAKPGKQWNRGLSVPMIFCLTILLACRVQFSSASGWFTAKTELGLSSMNHVNLGASGGRLAASLSGPVREELGMSTGDMEYLFQDISEQDFMSAERRLAGLSAQSMGVNGDDYVVSRAFQLHYTFTYLDSGDNFPEAYVRFRLNHTMSNMVMLNGSEEKCVQTLQYIKPDGDSVQMPSISFAGQGVYYYFPMPLKPGETIEIKYLLFLPEGLKSEFNDDKLLFSYEIISVSNNASALKWNVVFQDETVTPFDYSACVETPYAPYVPKFIRIEQPPLSDKTGLGPEFEGQAGEDREEEPANGHGDELILSENENNEQVPRDEEEETSGSVGEAELPPEVVEDSQTPQESDEEVSTEHKGRANPGEGKEAFTEFD